MTGIVNSFCSYCGYDMTNALHNSDGLQCLFCDETTLLNAVPVAVLIASCGIHESGRKHGVFTVRLGEGFFKGKIAFPEGSIAHTKERQETWQQAACRNAYEEINITCRHDSPFERPVHILTESSYVDKHIGDRVFIIGASKGAFGIGPFIPSKKAQERIVLFPDDKEQLCFPIHRKALSMHWDSLGVDHNVDLTDT